MSPLPLFHPTATPGLILHLQVHLVTQHSEEFSRMLDGRWAMTTLRGDMGPRAGFGHLARCHDLIICTAKLLQLALASKEEEEHVELTGEGWGGAGVHLSSRELELGGSATRPASLPLW